MEQIAKTVNKIIRVFCKIIVLNHLNIILENSKVNHHLPFHNLNLINSLIYQLLIVSSNHTII